METKAGLSLPFGQFGKGTANAGASAEAAIGFFYRPKNMAQPFAEVLFDALTSIPAPLDLDEISHAVNLSGLEGMVLGCDGAVDTGLGLVLGESYDIPNIASGRRNWASQASLTALHGTAGSGRPAIYSTTWASRARMASSDARCGAAMVR